MVDLDKVYSKVLSESKKSHLKHLFEDGEMTFDDIRSIFKDVFKGKIRISPKVKSFPFALTCKDGSFMVSDNKQTLKDPLTVEQACRRCKCSQAEKDAVVTAIGTMIDKLSKLDFAKQNSLFGNGQNFLKFSVVVPDEKQKSFCNDDYFIQKDGMECYDNTFSDMIADSELNEQAEVLLDYSKGPGISEDSIKRLKSSYSPDAALEEALGQLESIVDGVGYKARVNDYVAEQLSKLIVNAALKHGIDIYKNSDFVNELISRISYVFSRKPTKGDLFAYAKRDGLDVKDPALKELIEYFDQNAETINSEVLKPIEKLALNASVLLVKCFIGIVSTSQNPAAQRLVAELERLEDILKQDEELTPEKIAAVRKCIKKLDAFQKSIPDNGILFMHNGKVYKMLGDFGKIESIMKLISC